MVNGSIAHASGSTGDYNPRMLMMRSLSSSTARATTPPPESFGDLSCAFTPPTTPHEPRFKFLTSCAVDSGKLMTNYINSINPTNIPTSHRRDWVYYVSFSKTYEEKKPAIPLPAIFGWSTRGPSRRLSQARSDIAFGSPTLLHVIYLLYRNHYDCTCEIRAYPGYWSDTDFMTFSPTSPYILPDSQGHTSPTLST
jgi:hypothetical protein